LGLGLALLAHVACWLAGALPFPSFSLPVAFTAVYTPATFATWAYADRVAVDCLMQFRPALGLTQEQCDHWQYRLTTLPAIAVVLGYLLGAVFLWAYLQIDPSFLGLRTGYALPDVVLYLLGWVNSGTILVSIFYLYWKLSAVSKLHDAATRLNLYDWQPLFAFSNLTYRIAVIAIILVTSFVVVFPALIQNPLGLATVAVSYLAILALFALPLAGLHGRLVREKERVQGEVRHRIQEAVEALHRKVDAADLTQMQAMRDQLTALIMEEDYLVKLRTWPWSPGMLNRLIALVALPILIFLIQLAARRFLGI
jgi:hypothetical protein